MCFMLGLITDNHFGYENKPLREERLIFQLSVYSVIKLCTLS